MIQYMPLEGEARVAANWKWLLNHSEKERLGMTVPVLESAERYYVLVIGADRAKTLVMPSGPSPATAGIDAYRP
jgi:6-phosphogluconolactonase/glucosamine-6-phosphate isomerase/deaminase